MAAEAGGNELVQVVVDYLDEVFRNHSSPAPR